MKGSLRLGTPSALAHSSSFAALFVAMMICVAGMKIEEIKGPRILMYEIHVEESYR